MKYRCTVAHEEPLEGGGFRRFEAGQEYEGNFEGNPYFIKTGDSPESTALKGKARNSGTVPLNSTKTDKTITKEVTGNVD